MSALLYPLPDTPAYVVRALVLEDLARITSFPQVQRCPHMEARLNERHAKQERRKHLAEPEPITGWSDLA